jgi:hypothetical protein
MRYVVLLSVLAVTGCASKEPKPEPIGEGRYTISAESPSQASNAAAVTRRLAIKQATRFCAKDQHGLDWLGFDDGTTDHSYTTTLTFRCR